MTWRDRALRMARALLRKEAMDREMDEEMRIHLEMEAEELARTRGIAPEEALRRARLAFGSVEKYREEGRDARGVSRIEDWVRVVRFTVRRLVRSPGYSSVVVLTLGIGLGAVTAIYALIHAILLSPLPFPESERLVAIKHTSRLAGHEEVGISGGLYQHYRSNAASFEQIAVYTESSVHYSDELADVELVQAASAGPELFEVLGVGPMAGRLFTAAEWEPVVAEPGLFNTGVRLPIVISHEFWRQRYHGSREVLGEIVEIRGAPREIVGGSRDDEFTLGLRAPVPPW